MTYFLLSFFSRNRRIDNRTRRDRTGKRQQLFEPQMEAMTNAYMAWSFDAAHGTAPDAGLSENNGSYSFTIVDVFGTRALISFLFVLSLHRPTVSRVTVLSINSTDKFICSALIRQGIMPSSPATPNLGFSIQSLELFRIAHLRCSQQTFIKTLSDLHSVCICDSFVFIPILMMSSRSNIKNISPASSP